MVDLITGLHTTRRAALGLLSASAASTFLPTPAIAGDPLVEWPVRWHETTAATAWRPRAVPRLGSLPASPFAVDATIRIDAPAQTIAGFGAAFSEKGWQALSALAEPLRDEALRALFGPEGCGFSLCRTPIGANDISRGWYSYDEVAGDFALDHFSIANDRETLIPYIRAAQAIKPDLRLWASPWSPPTWMKRGGHYAQAAAWPGQPDTGIRPEQYGLEGVDSFIVEDRYLEAYARYFRRYVEGYASEGIRIDTVMPQNEFNSAQPFPSCCWSTEGLARFLRHLGPEMAALGVRVFLGTLERGNAGLVDRVLSDPEAARMISGIGAQWAGKNALPGIQERHGALELWGTEQECGVGTNDWHYARHGWRTIKRYFEAGASAWHYWNMAMPVGGMSGWGWPQNSLLVVDTAAGTFRPTHDYWLMRHLAGAVRPNARMVPVQSFFGFEDQLAFANPDGSLVLVVSNPDGQPLRVRYQLGSNLLELELAADSINTLVLSAQYLANSGIAVSANG